MGKTDLVENHEKFVKETVCRLTVKDIKLVIDEKFPHFSDLEKEKAIEIATEKLEIDWTEYVNVLLDVYHDEIVSQRKDG